jgi:nitrate/TMAO reductase-like tetraheme cytochrome c subunit
MFDPTAIFVLIVALLGAVVALRAAGPLAASRWGGRALLMGVAVLPIAATAVSLRAGVQESSRTRFCLSCHEMQGHGKSLFVDERRALPAVHYQNRLIDRDTSCYACHTDYALFGDFKAKLNGLKHVWVHYLGKVPEKFALHQPYTNSNCLHCHDDGRRFIEAPPHQAVLGQLRAGGMSCLTCHNLGHDLPAVDARRFWQAN